MSDAHDDAATRREAPGRVRERRRRGRSWAKRKHLGLITVGAAVLVLAVGLLVVVLTWDSGRTPLSQQAAAFATGSRSAASGAPTTGATGGSATPTGSTAPTSSSSPAATLLRGTVTAVGDSRFTVRSPTGIDYTVLVDDGTTFSRGRDFDSYPTGEAIVVRGTLVNGVVTATSITPGR